MVEPVISLVDWQRRRDERLMKRLMVAAFNAMTPEQIAEAVKEMRARQEAEAVTKRG